MKRITSSILVALAAGALYINSSPSVQAGAGEPSVEMVRFDAQEAMSRQWMGQPLTGQDMAVPVIHGVVVDPESILTAPHTIGSKPSHSGTESGATSSDSLIKAPITPNDLKLYHLKGEVQLGWTPQPGETYNIYFREQSGGKYTRLPMGSSTGAYTLSDMRYHEPTFYVVEAINGWGKSSYSNEVSSRPNKVSGLQAILNEEEESIGLSWSDPQEGLKYHVYYAGPDGARSRLNDVPVESRSYIIPNLNMLSGQSGRYTIHVVAVNEWNVSSEPSNEVALDVKKDPEDRITITDPSVAWPSEDLEEGTTPKEQKSAP